MVVKATVRAGAGLIALRSVMIAVLVGAAPLALAAETGSISGKVADASGGVLPGVLVTVSGPQLPAGRTFATTATGAYNFQRLIPGRYVVVAELSGIGKAGRAVDVQVDRDYQIDLVLKGSTAAVVEVSAASVDGKSTEITSNFAREEILQLPLPRSYEGLLNLIPGAPSVGTGGFVAVAGGTRQENKYLVDGVNVTNPSYGYVGIDTNVLDIADLSVKTGAISAEFGRTSGAIVNAVTKSGTNEFKGNVGFEARPSSFSAAHQHLTTQGVDTYNGAASLGFPVLKDTLFGYASVRYSETTTAGKAATIGGVTTTQPDTKTKNTDYFGKLTAYLGQSVLVNAGFRRLPNNTDNGFDSAYDAASAAWSSEATNYVSSIAVSWFVGKDTVVEAKYVHAVENATFGAVNILTDRPMTLDPANLWKYGAWPDPARNNGNAGVSAYTYGGEAYRRDEIKLTASHFLDIGATQHQVKVGGGAEFDDHDFLRQTNGWGTLVNNATYAGARVIRAQYFTTQPKQLGRARTYSAFLQDTVTWKRLSANVGVLFNYDDFAQQCVAGTVCGTTTMTEDTRYNFLTFRWGEQVQPRVGVVYNTELLKGDKLYTNYGEYAGLDQKSTTRSYAPYRIRADNSYFNLTTGAFIADEVQGSSTGKLISPDLEAPYYQEWVIGYSAPVGRYLSFDVHYQYKNLKNPFEDTPIDPNNYNTSRFQAKTFPDARRVYRGITLDITKRYSNSWYANLSYTYSDLYGNWDDDYAQAQFNTSSILEDGPGSNSAEPNRFGKLGQDRPHVFKVLGSYDILGFTLGGFLRVQSGTPWEARGKGGATTSAYYRYLEPAGSRRNPTWTNLDMLVAYTLGLGDSMSVRLEGRVQNVFNSQTALAVNQTQYLDAYKNGTPPSQLGPQGTTQPNALFGTETSWASPRRFFLSALLAF